MTCKDGESTIIFCMEKDCLKADSEASKAKRRERLEKEQARGPKGTIISGAENYRLGQLYANACLANWEASAAEMTKVTNWLKNDQPFLILQGVPGTGKTFLSAAILNWLFDAKYEVMYTTQRRFIEAIHQGMQKEETQHHTIGKFAFKHFLIFDDLGAGTNTEWQQEMILELIDIRYSRKSKTFFTTNLTEQQIENQLGYRTASRLFDKANVKIEFWKVEDRRKTPKPKNQESEYEGD